MDTYQIGHAIAINAIASSEETTIHYNLDPFTADQIRKFVNGVIDGVEQSGRQVKGVRTETPTLVQLGIQKDRANSGKYRDIPVVEMHLSLLGSPIEIVIAAA